MTNETDNGRATMRTALVTGALSGIGRAIALQLASRGLHVFGTTRRHGQLATSAFHDARGMANVAVFVAPDKASGMTGTTVNLNMGRLDD